MVHPFEEVRTRNPPTPTRPPRRPLCRKRHGGPSSGTRSRPSAPPKPPNPPPMAPGHPTPGLGHQRPPPSPGPPQREEKGHGQGEGKGQRETLRQGGTGGPKVTGRRPSGQGTGDDTTWEQETTQAPGKGGNGDRAAGKEDITVGTRTHTQERHTTTEGSAPPHPQRTPHDPPGRTPPIHAAEVRIGCHMDHTGTRPPATGNHTWDGGHTCTGRTGHTHRGSHWEHRRAAHHHALTARRRPRPP